MEKPSNPTEAQVWENRGKRVHVLCSQESRTEPRKEDQEPKQTVDQVIWPGFLCPLWQPAPAPADKKDDKQVRSCFKFGILLQYEFLAGVLSPDLSQLSFKENDCVKLRSLSLSLSLSLS